VSELIHHLDIDWILRAYIIHAKDTPANNVLGNVDAERLASAVLGIANFAYDSETYILWVK